MIHYLKCMRLDLDSDFMERRLNVSPINEVQNHPGTFITIYLGASTIHYLIVVEMYETGDSDLQRNKTWEDFMYIKNIYDEFSHDSLPHR